MPFVRYSLPLAVAVLLAATPSLAQERDTTLPRVSPNAAASFQLGVTQIEVTYGAPSVRERTIYGELVPFGEVWRTGANEATTITFSTDVFLEGHPLEAGSYMLATLPERDRWTIIINDQPGQWGTYQYDPELDVLRVEVAPQPAPMRETMAFTFDNLTLGEERDQVELVLRWAELAVPIRLATETDRHVEAAADAALLEDDWRRPFTFARYALQTGRHMDKALEWVDAAVLQQQSYATLALRARLQAQHEDFAGAVETARRALALAAAMDEAPPDAGALEREVDAWRARP